MLRNLPNCYDFYRTFTIFFPKFAKHFTILPNFHELWWSCPIGDVWIFDKRWQRTKRKRSLPNWNLSLQPSNEFYRTSANLGETHCRYILAKFSYMCSNRRCILLSSNIYYWKWIWDKMSEFYQHLSHFYRTFSNRYIKYSSHKYVCVELLLIAINVVSVYKGDKNYIFLSTI